MARAASHRAPLNSNAYVKMALLVHVARQITMIVIHSHAKMAAAVTTKSTDSHVTAPKLATLEISASGTLMSAPEIRVKMEAFVSTTTAPTHASAH